MQAWLQAKKSGEMRGDMANLSEIAGNAPAPAAQVTQTAEGTPRAKERKEIEALDLESARLRLQTQKLELQEREANLQDLQERLAEREMKRENKRQRSITNGVTLKALDGITKATQNRCNHKKGGNGAQGVVGGRGDDSQYAVLKHTFANGDMWIRCLRCGKTWKPPVKRAYKTEEEYRIAWAVYEQAKEFQTRNTPSSSYLFRYSDNGEYYREVTESTTLK